MPRVHKGKGNTIHAQYDVPHRKFSGQGNYYQLNRKYIYIYYTNSQQKDPKDAVPPREFVDKYRVRMVGQTDLTKFNYFLAVWPSSN